MKVSGEAVLHADPARVYAALNDPAVLVRTIPGCETLEARGDDRYLASVTAGVASIKGSYEGEVTLSEQCPPDSFLLHAKGSGAPGTVDASVRVTLTAAHDGSTRLGYDADAVVGGMVGGVGQRMLSSASRRTAGEFFANVDRVLTGADLPAPAAPAVAIGAAAAEPAAGTVFRAPVEHRAGPGAGELLAAAATGAAIAMVGVAVGWRLRARR